MLATDVSAILVAAIARTVVIKSSKNTVFLVIVLYGRLDSKAHADCHRLIAAIGANNTKPPDPFPYLDGTCSPSTQVMPKVMYDRKCGPHCYLGGCADDGKPEVTIVNRRLGSEPFGYECNRDISPIGMKNLRSTPSRSSEQTSTNLQYLGDRPVPPRPVSSTCSCSYARPMHLEDRIRANIPLRCPDSPLPQPLNRIGSL